MRIFSRGATRRRPAVRGGERVKRAVECSVQSLEGRVMLASVLGISRSSPATAITGATSVTYAVTFSESVTGVDASDFQLVTTASAAANTPVVVAGSGSAYTVTVNGIHGSGTLQLNLLDDDSIRNALNVPLQRSSTNPNGGFWGQSYTILQPALVSAVSLNRTNPAGPSTGVPNGSVQYTLTFSGNVTGVDSTDFQVVTTGAVTASPVVAVTPVNGSTYTLQVNGVSGGSGTLGVNLLDNGSIRDAASGYQLQASPATAGTFAPLQTVSTAIGVPYWVETADVNGDGKPDLLSGNLSTTGTISVVLGNGNGTFAAPQTFAVASGNGLTVGDVNGDGKADVLSDRTGSVNLLLGNGNGTFGAPQVLPATGNPYQLLLADINGDGAADLLYSNPSNGGGGSVGLMLGNGNGTFAPPSQFLTGTTAHAVDSRNFRVKDVNGDGLPDLLVANYSDGTLSVLLGNGNGSFKPQTTYLVGSSANWVAAEDLNGDSIPDVVIPHGGSNYLSVLLGNGNGTFAPQVTYTTGNQPDRVAIADMNGDGKEDVVVAANTGMVVDVLLGNGNGTLQPRRTTSNNSLQAESLSLSDFNLDGRPDAAIGLIINPYAHVFLNGSSGGITGQTYTVVAPPAVTSIARSSPAGAYTTAGTLTYTVNFSSPVTGVDASDFQVLTSGSVSTSSVSVSGSGSTYNVTVVAHGSGSVQPELVDNDTIVDSLGTPLNRNGVNGSFLGPAYSVVETFPTVLSINRSNPAGFVAAGNSVSYTVTFSTPVTGVDATDFVLAPGGGATAAGPIVVTPVSGSVYTVTVNGIVGPVGGGGTLGLNLVDNNSIRDPAGNPLKGGPAAFAPAQTFATGTQPTYLSSADFNLDGVTDLAYSNSVSASVGVMLGNGNGTFQPQRTFSVFGTARGLAATDLNGDGKPDLVVASYTGFNNTRVNVLLGNGSGGFLTGSSFYPGGTDPRAVATGDVNGDGKPDVLVTNYTDSTISILLNNGGGNLGAFSNIPAGARPKWVTLADMNGDNVLDIVATAQASGTVGIYLGNGNGTFQPRMSFPSGPQTWMVAVGDLNGDGIPDTVATNSNTTGNTVGVLLGNGNGTMGSPTTYPVGGTQPLFVSLTDVNGDGKLDVAAADLTTNSFSVLPGNGNGTLGPPQTFSTAGAAFGLVAGDFNSDGRPDLAVTNQTGGSLGVYPGAGAGNFTGQVYEIQRVYPTVASISRTNPVGPVTSAQSVSFTVTFSAPVTGVDATDFALSLGGVTASTPVVVSPVSASVYTVTVNGIAGAGTLGLNLADNGTIRDAVGSPLQGLSFLPRQTYTTGNNNPRAVLASDVNGDGKLDLVVGSAGLSNPNVISVLFGNGNGTFQPQLTTPVPSLTSLAAADLNGDGRQDLVIGLNTNPGTSGVMLGNGDGSFQALQTFPAGFSPRGLALADTNGDGRLDLFIANTNSQSVSVLLGNGDGTFKPQATFAAATGGNPMAITLADFNGDGRQDVAVSGNLANSVSVLLANGDGTLAPQQTFAGPPQSWGIASGDVNGDGRADLLVGGYGAHVMSVLLGNGNGTFAAQQTYATAGNNYAVAVTDANGDGTPDAVALNRSGSSISVLLGNSDGTLRTQQTFALTSLPTAMAVADFDGDGRIDVAAPGFYANTSVLRGNGSVFTGQTYTIAPTVVTSVSRSSPLTPTTSSNALVYTVNFSAPVTGLSAAEFRVITTGNVAVASPVVLAGSGASYTVTVNGVHGTGTVQLNLIDRDTVVDGVGSPIGGPGLWNGSFTGQTYTVLQPFPTVTSINRSSPGAATIPVGTSSVTFAVNFSTPVTGVDATDFQAVATGGVTFASPVVVSGSGPSYSVTVNGIGGTAGTLGLNLLDDGSVRDAQGNPLQNNPSGVAAFSAPQSFSASAGAYFTTTADVNADGKTDVVVANYTAGNVGVFLGNGNGTFTPQLTYATGASADCATATDVNGDGIPDLVVANWNGLTVSILLGNGNGTFLPQTTLAAPGKPFSIAATDVNGDGRPDLLVDSEYGNSVGVILGNGNGTFAAPVTYATGLAPFTIAAGDFNGDGAQDFAVTNASSSTVSVFINNGNGTFAAQQTYATAAKPYSLTAADVNGDGKFDLVTSNENANSVSVLLGNGNGTFAAQQTAAVGAQPVSVVVADPNGDGVQDLLVANLNGNSVSVLVGNGDGTYKAQQTFAAGPGSYHLAGGDFNRDGRIDLAVADFTGPALAVLTNTGSGPFTGQTYTLANLGPSKLGFANPPSDTVAGSVIDSPTGIQIAVQDASGATVTTDSSTVTLTLSTGTFSTGSNTATAQAVNGVATFNNLIVNAVGSYTITASDGSLTPVTSLTFQITKATPTVAVTDSGGTYNTTPFPATATVAGFGSASTPAPSLEGVFPTLSYYAGTFTTVASLSGQTALPGAPSVAGSYTVLATFPGSTDYTSASALANFSVAKATPTVSASDAGGTYTTSPFPATASVGGVGSQSTPAASLEAVPVTLAYYAGTFATPASLSGQTPLPGAPSAAGAYTVLASYAGSSDYLAGAAVVNFTIAKATPVVSVSDAGGPFTGSPYPATASVAGVGSQSAAGPTLESVGISLTYYSGTFTTVASLSGQTPLPGAPTSNGQYTVLASFPGSVDYVAGSALANFSIGKLAATVAVSDLGGTYNTNPFPATATVAGQGANSTPGPTLEGVGLTLSYYSGTFTSVASLSGQTPLPGTPGNAGNYTALATFPGSTDYLSASALTNFTIGRRSITASVLAFPKTYDQTTAATVNVTVSPLSGDTLSATYTAANFPDKNAGNNKTVTVNGISLTGTSAPNYTLSASTATATATINPRPLNVTATAQDKSFDGGTAATVTLSDNRLAGDVFSDFYASANFSDPAPGSGKTVTVTGIFLSGPDAPNYAPNTSATATASILLNSLTIGVIASFPSNAGPATGVVLDSSGNLYGAANGGTGSNGTLFKVTNGQVSTLAAFNGTNGSGPRGRLLVDAAGNVYGVTNAGGSKNLGTVFKYSNGAITTLASFQGTNGASPSGGVNMDAAGNLYGVASSGGASGQGAVWELPSGSNTITALASFNFTNGATPLGTLVMDAAGNLYGTTQFGGASNAGTIYELASGASNITSLASLSSSVGANPEGGLVLDAAGNLYGTAPTGGANGNGTVFELPAGSNTAIAFASFNGTNGAAPYGTLLMDSGGNLFGSTSSGGATNFGGVFEIPKATGSLALLASFSGSDGSSPAAPLVLDGNGNFFLTTRTGGTAGGGGTLVRLTPPVLSSFRGSAAADSIILKLDVDHTHLHWQINNDAGVMTASDAVGLSATGNGGNDVITLDYTFGNPIPANLHLEGTFTFNGLQTLDPFAGATIDIGHSTVFLSYPSLSSDPIAAVKAYLGRGYAGGAWNGTATASAGVITSTAAQTNPNRNTAIGYIDWSDGTGLNTTPNTVELRYTVSGDANLDGVVNSTDSLLLARNYPATGSPAWNFGNFNYDAVTDYNDALILQKNFNQTVPAPAAAPATAYSNTPITAVGPSLAPAPQGPLTPTLPTANTGQDPTTAKKPRPRRHGLEIKSHPQA